MSRSEDDQMASKRKKQVAVERTMSVADAVSEACGEIAGLGEEMREAFDNTPESLQSSSVGEARGEAADALENMNEPDVPEKFGTMELKIVQFPLKSRAGRATRRDQATGLLDQVITFLGDLELDDSQERDDFVSDLENYKGEAENVEFPGMFG